MTRSAKQIPAPPPEALRRSEDDSGSFPIPEALRDSATMLPPAGDAARADVLSLEALGGIVESDEHAAETPLATERGLTSGVFGKGSASRDGLEEQRFAELIASSQPYYRGDEDHSERAQLQIDDLSLQLDNPFLASSLVPPARHSQAGRWVAALAVGGAIATAVAWFAHHETRASKQSAGAVLAAKPVGLAPAAHVAVPEPVAETRVAAASEVAAPTVSQISTAPGQSPPPAPVVAITSPAKRPPSPERALPQPRGVAVPAVDRTVAPNSAREAPLAAEAPAEPPAAQPPSAALPAAVAEPATALPVPVADESAALPDSPSREDVVAALERVHGDLEQCVAGKHGVAKIEVTIANTGRVSRAVVDGVFKGTPEGSCIARAVRGARFPLFSQPSLSVSYPVSL
jgi:hypothetical protein